MCGIVGFMGYVDEGRHVINCMTDTITHRGPDAKGVWIDDKINLFFGHRRLSILDVTESGSQPMLSHCGRYAMVFNGEIYNHLALKKEVELAGNAIGWNGRSDTEILLASFSILGLEHTLQLLVGMYAIALWDRVDCKLILARDRMGEKPLYYGRQGSSFLFASELKALVPHPEWIGSINQEALADVLRYGCVAGNKSIYSGINKLPPGTYIEITEDNCASHIDSDSIEPIQYWSLSACPSNLSDINENEAIFSLDSVLRESVKGQMVADVPLGAFLSGGIDSSLVVAMMQQESSSPIQTFSIGFDEDSYNEAHYANSVAKHLQTNHTELYVSPKEAQQIIPKLPYIYDEPFCDSSQIPTYLVAELAKRHVTVSLSGDGGDELFGGYNRYVWASRIWRNFKRVPLPLQNFIAKGVHAFTPSAWDKIFHCVKLFIPRSLSYNYPGDRIHKMADLLGTSSPEQLYWKLVSHWQKPADLLLGYEDKEPVSHGLDLSNIEDMMYLDAITYLPDDILTKVDRATMSVSLESRMPLLDHRVVEFARTIPLSMKIREGQGKWILRQVLYKYVPKQLLDRPKMGFGVPIDRWLRGPLRDWAESLLNKSRLINEGYFNPVPIRRKWAEHLSGRRNWQYQLWNVLMFQAWLEASR